MRTFGILLSLVAMISDAAPTRPVVAKVVSLTGKVMVKRQGVRAPEVFFPKEGDALQAGDIVQTASKSALKLLFVDKTIADLGEMAILDLQEFSMANTEERQVLLGLYRGQMRTSVTQKLGARGNFRIRTPSATLGVRGTEFLIDSGLQAKAAQTQVTVVHGAVEVAGAKAPMRIGPGDRFTARAELPRGLASVMQNKAFTPAATFQMEKLNPAQMQALTQNLSALKQDRTFQNAVTVEGGANVGRSGRGTMQIVAQALPPPPKDMNGKPVQTAGMLPKDFGNKIFDPGINGAAVNLSVTFQK